MRRRRTRPSRGATAGPRGRVASGRIPRGILQVVDRAEPDRSGRELDVLGTLSVGFSLDEQPAEQFKALTNSDIAFGVDGDGPGVDAAATRRARDAGRRWPARTASTA